MFPVKKGASLFKAGRVESKGFLRFRAQRVIWGGIVFILRVLLVFGGVLFLSWEGIIILLNMLKFGATIPFMSAGESHTHALYSSPYSLTIPLHLFWLGLPRICSRLP